MKRKIMLVAFIAIILGSALFAGNIKDYNGSNKTNNGCYHIKCYKCAELAKKHKTGECYGCNAWRTVYFKVVGGEKCMVYRCSHGHELYVSLESNKRM